MQPLVEWSRSPTLVGAHLQAIVNLHCESNYMPSLFSPPLQSLSIDVVVRTFFPHVHTHNGNLTSLGDAHQRDYDDHPARGACGDG